MAAEVKQGIALNYIIVGVVCVVVGFGAGWALKSNKTQKPVSAAFGTSGFEGRFRGGASGGFGGGGRTFGTVLSLLSNGFTVKSPTGSTETVYTTSSTTYTQQTTASSSTVTQGGTVEVTGAPNSDGSVTATTVEGSTGLVNTLNNYKLVILS